MAKHTPGPWTVRRSPAKYDGAYDFAINAVGAPVIAEAFGRSSDGGWPPAEANARLIAASPDLLTSLRAILPYAESRAEDMDEEAEAARICGANYAESAHADAAKAVAAVDAAKALLASLDRQ